MKAIGRIQRRILPLVSADSQSSICPLRDISRCNRRTAGSSSISMARFTITARSARRSVGPGATPQGGWRGHSDTETLIEAVAAWGLEPTLAKCSAMFAFALWDRSEDKLVLVRDRFGEKPLYYGWAGRDFVFASELKALRAHARFEPSIDRLALELFMQRGFVPAPLSIYRRIFKLPPGCILTVEPGHQSVDVPLSEGGSANGVRLGRYWSYRQVVESGLANPFDDEADALEQLE